MNCPRPAEIHELLEGGLSPAERSAVEDHLAACPRCRRRAAEWRAIEEAAAGLAPLVLPPDFPARVMTRIGRRSSSHRRRRMALAAVLGSAALTAALAVFLAGDPLASISGLAHALGAALKTTAGIWAGLARFLALLGDVLRPLLRTSGGVLSALAEVVSPGLQALLIVLSLGALASLAYGLRRHLSSGEQR
jgi:predicted anti-sigma-YlaC factor YlaD